MPGDLLVGDIGGTNGRFGLVGADGLRPRLVLVEEGSAHAGFAAALAAYLDKTGVRPKRAALAVAGPVREDGGARVTNRPGWEVDPHELKRRFGFDEVLVINDFAAQAASLPHLEPSETIPIGPARPRAAVKAAVGPGTGLGVAALIPGPGGWRPLAGEGGHVDFAPLDGAEAAAFDVIRRETGRVSAEHVVSGPGLARLHDALAEVAGAARPGLAPGEIARAAAEGEPRALATARMFLGMLARFAGDVALTFGARGGVHLCGGVTPHLMPALDPEAFRAAFEAKSPHEAMMRDIATIVVASPVAGLVGAAAAARAQW